MKLYESLHILTSSIEMNLNLYEIIMDHSYHTKPGRQHFSPKELSHYMTLHFAIILNTTSFLEEYDHNFIQESEDAFKNRIRDVKQILKSAYSRIKKWKDLKTIRNELIAHPQRIGYNGPSSLSKLWQYNAPRRFAEITILTKRLSMMGGVIRGEFAGEMTGTTAYMKAIAAGVEKTQDTSIIATELEEIGNQINLLSSKLGIQNQSVD